MGSIYCLPITNVVCLFTGFPDGKPIKVITDSIGKALPMHRLWSHHSLSGKTFKDATEWIISGNIRVGGLRLIAFHLGTNSMDYMGWGGMISWQEQLSSMQEEVKALYSSVRRFNATCFIVFSAVLPRGYDWQHSQELYLGFNLSCGISPEANIVDLYPSLPCSFTRMGRGKGAPLRACLQ